MVYSKIEQQSCRVMVGHLAVKIRKYQEAVGMRLYGIKGLLRTTFKNRPSANI